MIDLKKLILIFLIISCTSLTENSSLTKGTVKYISLEGGFYGIISENNEKFDPINLPNEFKKDGLKFLFSYKERNDLTSIHMWGKIIEIIEIKMDIK
ncbi:MAG: hypothetical protein N2321_05835 [Melioribacteraceae bacterium]|nr:hypothetical protein [Melioribacteraceae bacterium]